MNGLAGTRVLVVGSGAIGGVTAAHLRHAGVDVTSLVTNAQTRQALASSGYRLQGHTTLRHVPNPQVLELASDGARESFDFALLAVQPPQVERAVAEIEPLLKANARVVCFQNGLCEERIAQLVGAERVLGGIVAWGASMPEPGLFDKTSAGGFTLGRLTGPIDARCHELARILSSVGPVTYTNNLIGARFSKLAINCAVSTLGTLGGTNVGGLLNHAFVRRLALEIITEACDVAAALGVHLEKLATTVDVRWFSLRPDEPRRALHPSLLAKHALVYAVGRKYRRMRSSMLQAIERGRPPAVDFLNGELVTRGERLGIPVPVNSRARELVWQVARHERESSMGTLRQLFAETASGK
jgi:2-dehydropantoate 2-reductase